MSIFCNLFSFTVIWSVNFEVISWPHTHTHTHTHTFVTMCDNFIAMKLYWNHCVCVSINPCLLALSGRYHLNHSTFYNQTWYGGAVKILDCFVQGQNHRSQQRFKISITFFPTISSELLNVL